MISRQLVRFAKSFDPKYFDKFAVVPPPHWHVWTPLEVGQLNLPLPKSFPALPPMRWDEDCNRVLQLMLARDNLVTVQKKLGRLLKEYQATSLELYENKIRPFLGHESITSLHSHFYHCQMPFLIVGQLLATPPTSPSFSSKHVWTVLFGLLDFTHPWCSFRDFYTTTMFIATQCERIDGAEIGGQMSSLWMYWLNEWCFYFSLAYVEKSSWGVLRSLLALDGVLFLLDALKMTFSQFCPLIGTVFLSFLIHLHDALSSSTLIPHDVCSFGYLANLISHLTPKDSPSSTNLWPSSWRCYDEKALAVNFGSSTCAASAFTKENWKWFWSEIRKTGSLTQKFIDEQKIAVCTVDSLMEYNETMSSPVYIVLEWLPHPITGERDRVSERCTVDQTFTSHWYQPKDGGAPITLAILVRILSLHPSFAENDELQRLCALLSERVFTPPRLVS